MDGKGVLFIFLRYLILILLGIPGLFIFYWIFTPLTVYPVFYMLQGLYDAVFYPPNVIFFKGYFAELISACIGGAAYYLLTILNLTTPMNIKKRIGSLMFLLISFLILNIIRIIVFALLLFKGYQYFELTHTTTWYFGSTVMVVLIWFGNVLLFRIKNIPVYTDIKNLLLESNILKTKKTQE